MAAIYKPGILTIIPFYDIGAPHLVANVTHWRGQTISYSNTQLANIRDAFDAAWSANYHPLAGPTVRYMGANVIDSGSAFGGEANNAGYPPVFGSAAGTAIADNASGLISLVTLRRYKGGHGRLYIPGVSVSHTEGDGRTMTPQGITFLHNLYFNAQQALGAVGAGDGGPLVGVVWHKTLAGAENTTEDVVNIIGQPILASQRRRLRKVSRHKKKTP